MNRRACTVLIPGVVVCLVTAVCIKEFTRQRYETLYEGMSKQAVIEQIGRPTRRQGETWVYINKVPFYKATIRFKDGRLVDTSWTHDKGTEGPPRYFPPPGH